MRFLIALIICGLTIACSGSKKATNNIRKIDHSTRVTRLKNAPPGKIDSSETVSKKALEIIEKHTKYSIKDIARSQIIKTKDGYWWRFMNVRNGQNYIVTTDSNFSAVQIQKNPKRGITNF